MPGPAPDPNALRRERKNDQGSWTLLSAGRQGDPPAWPFSRANKRELEQWKREWARPQAVMWEHDGQQEEVALYVRTLVRSEVSFADPKLLPIVIRMQEALGLSQPGLLRRRWKIEEPAEPAKKRSNDPDRAAQKAALRAIVGGAA